MNNGARSMPKLYAGARSISGSRSLSALKSVHNLLAARNDERAPSVKSHLDGQIFGTMDLSNQKHSSLILYHGEEEIQ